MLAYLLFVQGHHETPECSNRKAPQARASGAFFCRCGLSLLIGGTSHPRSNAAWYESRPCPRNISQPWRSVDLQRFCEPHQVCRFPFGLSYAAKARTESAWVFGGERVETGQINGHFLAPTLAFTTTSDMTINLEAVFAPVASTIIANDYDHAPALANDTEFGLSAGICTTSLAKSRHFLREALAGMVMVNVPTAGVDPHVPFGDRKASSFGHANREVMLGIFMRP